MSLLLILLLIVLVLAICGGGGWYGSRNGWWGSSGNTSQRTLGPNYTEPFANGSATTPNRTEFYNGIQHIYGTRLRRYRNGWSLVYIILMIFIVICLIGFLIAFMSGHLGYIPH